MSLKSVPSPAHVSSVPSASRTVSAAATAAMAAPHELSLPCTLTPAIVVSEPPAFAAASAADSVGTQAKPPPTQTMSA